MIIYDDEGSYLGKLTFSSVGIFNVMFMDNYVLYVADSLSEGRIIRFDPHMTC